MQSNKVKPATLVLAWCSVGFMFLSLIWAQATFIEIDEMIYDIFGIVTNLASFVIFISLAIACLFLILTIIITINRNNHAKAKAAIIAMLVFAIMFFDILAIIGAALGIRPQENISATQSSNTPDGTNQTLEQKLAELDRLYTAGTITPEEYQNARTKIILNHR